MFNQMEVLQVIMQWSRTIYEEYEIFYVVRNRRPTYSQVFRKDELKIWCLIPARNQSIGLHRVLRPRDSCAYLAHRRQEHATGWTKAPATLLGACRRTGIDCEKARPWPFRFISIAIAIYRDDFDGACEVSGKSFYSGSCSCFLREVCIG